MRNRTYLGIILLIAPLVVGYRPVNAEHGTWHDHYHDETGIMCCRTGQDCLPAQVRVLDQTAQHVVLEINGTPVTLPQRRFNLSEDARDWVCWRFGRHNEITPDAIRCVFIAPGS